MRWINICSSSRNQNDKIIKIILYYCIYLYLSVIRKKLIHNDYLPMIFILKLDCM